MIRPITETFADPAQALGASRMAAKSAGQAASFDSLFEQVLVAGQDVRSNLVGLASAAVNASAAAPAATLARDATTAAQSSSTTTALVTAALGRDAMQSIYYGTAGPQRCSEKASEHGQFEISSFPVTTGADGLALFATNIYNRPDQQGAQGAAVGVYDYDAILALNGGSMPATPEAMQQLLHDHPEIELARATIDAPPQTLHIQGIPEGKRVVVGVGLEALDGGRGGRVQAMLADWSGLPQTTQQMLTSLLAAQPQEDV